jgi:prepilin-type N-terminal cleavage/methylation domain-containing protein
MRNKGFTITELMVAIVITLVMAGLAVPSLRALYTKRVEDEAITNLTTIFYGQKLFYKSNGYFYPGLNNIDPNINTVNQNLKTRVVNDKYFIHVQGNSDDFIATAYRQHNGDDPGSVWSIDKKGDIFYGTSR